MSMAGKTRTASGELMHTSGVDYITHNLGTKKILVIMQRVESDHSNIDTTNQFQSIMVVGATLEALDLDEQQTYSLNGGTAAHFNSVGADTNGAYPKGVNSYFPAANGAFPANGVMAYPYRGVRAWDGSAESNNVVQIYPIYNLAPGRWVWRAYALD